MPSNNPDPCGYYALLHVPPDASRQEIGRAFRALMRRHHPDAGNSGAGRGPGDSGAGEVSAILEAFAVLRDPRTRADYDAGRRRAVDQAGTWKGGAGHGGRDIPVRIIRRREPLLRVFPVRWEPESRPEQPPHRGR
ncbi:DnaJ domain-containing protein [Arthrobacter sp. ok909]|uniref:J domain-containing protein n=1 Tax=Arthrobacter sp. ok909 TaxID=1761746 RepID=UPI000891A8E7|nr:J domain-containing protein [Arthrobacter sp. ok909]SDP75961.1 DnaJ domain-containing protein [Arthrobacter sp. ok909]